MSSGKNWILPVGTQVVIQIDLHGRGGLVRHPRGAVGVITRTPVDGSHAYRVRLTDGTEVSLRQRELAVRKEVQRAGLRSPSNGQDLAKHVIYRCVIGSKAYGLDEPGSDVDRRGIYLPPAKLHWSLYGVPEQIQNAETQECYWELQKFLVLALKANPNVLECLYTPIVELARPIAEELRDRRSIFLSRLVYQTYNGYVMSQFKKLGQDLRNKGTIKWKHAMHLIRLLLAGVAALREGVVPVRVDEHRDRLLAIRRGEISWKDVDAWRLRLHKEFDAAFASTKLPELPDYDRANKLLLKARKEMA